MPLHMHPYYREKFNYRPEDLPCAAAIYHEILSLPLWPDLSEGEVRHICDQIKSIIVRQLR